MVEDVPARFKVAQGLLGVGAIAEGVLWLRRRVRVRALMRTQAEHLLEISKILLAFWWSGKMSRCSGVMTSEFTHLKTKLLALLAFGDSLIIRRPIRVSGVDERRLHVSVSMEVVQLRWLHLWGAQGSGRNYALRRRTLEILQGLSFLQAHQAHLGDHSLEISLELTLFLEI